MHVRERDQSSQLLSLCETKQVGEFLGLDMDKEESQERQKYSLNCD